MGVFARLLRRSGAPEEPSAAEATSTAQPVDAKAEATPEVTGSTGIGGEETAGTPGTRGTDASEDTAIPRQQTAGQAADNEAGENGRR
ncbi:hypothetical protein [Streptomyces sp. NPDC002580]|uniref:hypothetical protein n=1 Tax=Streptomyces sp. NPDC002580 TaxID=3364653 RepID=UPI0036B0C508